MYSRFLLSWNSRENVKSYVTVRGYSVWNREYGQGLETIVEGMKTYIRRGDVRIENQMVKYHRGVWPRVSIVFPEG